MPLEGGLDEIPLSDLIHLYCSGRHTARLTLSFPDGEAQLYVERGELVHAQFGPLSGIRAVHALLSRTGGSFHVEPDVVGGQRTISERWDAVIIRGAKLMDDERMAHLGVADIKQAAGGETRGPTRTLRVAGRDEKVMRAVAPSPPSRPKSLPTPPKPGGRDPRIFIIGGAAVLLIGAGVVYLLLRGRSAPPPPAPVQAAPLTMGMSAPLTGPSKELGRQMKLGIETSFAIANAGGGVSNRLLSLVALDDGYEPARTKETMQDLLERRKVFAIIGNVGTPTAEVSVPYSIDKKVLFFGAFTGAPLLRREPPDRYVFNYRASYAEETAAVVRYFIEVKGIRPPEIAVFAQQDGFGDAGFAGVAKALRKYGVPTDGILRVGFKRNTLDIQDAVDTILRNRKTVRAVVTVAPYRPAAKFIEKLRDAKMDALISNVSFVGSSALAEELRQIGPKYSSGVIVTQVVPPIDSASTTVLKYKEALAKYFPGEKPDFVSLEGYIAATIFVEGLKRAGPNPTTDSVIAALEGMQGLEIGIGTPISFGLSEHQGSHKVWGTVLNEAAQYQLLDLD
ncbi:MAG TPA: ABC transporter substrate-binding protein [Vicinamibacteria bacterium]|nr:ABC transporter substrate-binding protein [Vicinamibacteria bacterium]